jgi:mRNA-degrading endonuclease toxin of MazEF toxin-antitoxin module
MHEACRDCAVLNFNGLVLWVLPLTRTAKSNRFYYRLSDPSGDSAVVLSQLRLISSKRLIRKIRTLDSGQFGEIVGRLKGLLSG